MFFIYNIKSLIQAQYNADAVDVKTESLAIPNLLPKANDCKHNILSTLDAKKSDLKKCTTWH